MRISLLVTLLALSGCPSAGSGAECSATEQMCDDTCVPANAVCCNNGLGAICPLGYTCGTTSSTPCIRDSATIVTIQPPPATCNTMCRGGGCPVTFVPDPASVKVGDPIFWRNMDSAPHTLINTDNNNTPLTTAPANGMSGGIQFSRAGSYTIAAMDCPDPQFVGYLADGEVVVTVN